MEYSYILTINQEEEDDLALARNEIQSLLEDHIQKHPHFEEYGKITIVVERT